MNQLAIFQRKEKIEVSAQIQDGSVQGRSVPVLTMYFGGNQISLHFDHAEEMKTFCYFHNIHCDDMRGLSFVKAN